MLTFEIEREREIEGERELEYQGNNIPLEAENTNITHRADHKVASGTKGKIALFPGITAAALTILCKAYSMRCCHMFVQPTRLIIGNSR